MRSIETLRQQFRQGNGEWQLFIKSIKISNIHGWQGQEIIFNFPVVAVVGENGIGKSTFLKAAVCAYNNQAGKSFYPSKMFMSTQWDEKALSNASIEYKVKHGETERILKWKKTRDWGFSPKGKKPKRHTYFLDISRTLPLDATAGYAKIAMTSNAEAGNAYTLNEQSCKDLSFVLGQAYQSARFTKTNINAKEVGLLTKNYGEISQFHQGAGEDTILDLFKLLQEIPPQSLLVIDEVENSLHPKAQRRLVRYLLDLARRKKLQIILSTHSPFVLEELPPDARIMLVRFSDRKGIMYGVSSQYALSTIDDKEHPEVYIYVEDAEAKILFLEILKKNTAKYEEYLQKISIQAVGSCDIVETLNKLAKANRMPYPSIAIVDGDCHKRYPDCLCLPGTTAPEKMVFEDLKKLGWKHLDERFGIGAGHLFQYLEDAMLQQDVHEWTTYVGDKIHKNKESVWTIMAEEWCKQCLNEQVANEFLEEFNSRYQSLKKK